MRFEVKNLGFYFKNNQWVLRHVSFAVEAGERVALVAPSGYGKSTLSRLMAGYLVPQEGEVLLDGQPLPRRGYCPVQMIYQHPEKAIDPYWSMQRVLREAWQPDALFLARMGIQPAWLQRRPHELSGGELQRFCIARVLGPRTQFLIADEISTMLDAVTQVQIWTMLLEYLEERQLGCMIITHNEALARRVCTRRLDLRELNRL